MPITSTKEINRVLYEKLKTEKSVKVSNLDGQDCIAVNIAKDVKVNVEGRAGDFFGALNKGASIILKGNAGKYLGYKMSKGIIIVTGTVEGVGDFLGGSIFVSELKTALPQEAKFVELTEEDKELLALLKVSSDKFKKIVSKDRKKLAYLELGKPLASSLKELVLLKDIYGTKEFVDINLRVGSIDFPIPIFLVSQKPNEGFAYASCLVNSFAICRTKEELEIVRKNNGKLVIEWPELVEALEDCDLIVLRYESPKEVELLREATNYKKPILVRVSPKNIYKDLRELLAYGPEGVIIDCSYFPAMGAIPAARKAIIDSKKTTLLLVLVSLKDTKDVIKLFALGVSGVGLILEEKSGDWQVVGNVVANVLKRLTEELKLQLGATGCRSLRELTPENLRALTYDAAAITGVKLLGYERALPFWEY